MILQALYDYAHAHREEVLGAPHVIQGKIACEIVLDQNGDFKHAHRLDEQLHVFAAAGNEAATTGQYIKWLSETVARTIPSPNDEAKDTRKQDRLLELTRQAAEETGSETAKALLRFLERLREEPDLAERVHAELKTLKVKPIDRVTFTVIGGAHPMGKRLIEDEALGRWYGGFFEEAISSGLKTDPDAQCLVTGKRNVPLANTHKGLRFSPDQPILASFDKAAFTSYNWTKGQNAPMSQEAMEGYCAAFEHLANAPEHRFIVRQRKPSGPGDEVMRFLFWTRKGPIPYIDEFLTSHVTERGREEMLRILHQPWKGKKDVDLPDGEAFHVVCFSVNKKRIMLRAASSGTLGELRENLLRWQAETEIRLPWFLEHRRPMPKQEGQEKTMKTVADKGEVSAPLNFSEIRDAVLAPAQNLPDTAVPAIFQAVLFGKPLPAMLLHGAVGRVLRSKPKKKSSDEGTNESTGTASSKSRRTWTEKFRVRFDGHKRAALLRALLNQLYRQQDPKGDYQMDRELEGPPTESTAFLLGRLFAVYEKVQDAKTNKRGRDSEKLNVTLGDRYFSAFCSSPGAVQPNVHKLVNKLLGQLRRQEGRAGCAADFQKRIGEIISSLDHIPMQHNVRDQAEFILGYYKEHATKKDATEPEVENETALAAADLKS
ncbi:MAG: type I-C CRISPR-associated protein Cas8c/Csd1 [Sumerlaeia bacterium]